jgi:cytochrome c-type biogenesis protein CcmF
VFEAPGEAVRRLFSLPRASWGTALGHFGIGVSLLGIVAVSAFETERITTVRPGQRVDLAGYELTFEGLAARRGPNYNELVGRFVIRSGGTVVGTKESAKRLYTATGTPTTEAGIVTFGFSQLYVTMGDVNPDGSAGVKLYYKPLVLLIWIGTVIMAFGGVVSLSDRRLRVGAPAKARRRRVDATPQPMPAE